MLRQVTRTGAFMLLAAVLAAPASAQIVQSLHIGAGGFFPRGYDGRASGDVLVEDLNSLAFTIKDFNSWNVFGEWLVAFGPHIEASAGVSYYKGSAPTIYQDLTHPDGTEIEQELGLRVVPITAMVRFLPIGRTSSVQPYFGIGLSALPYRYTESGEFVDYSDYSTFKNRYVATGTAIGATTAIGARIPLKGDIWGLTTEWRYQFGTGDTGGLAAGFLNDKIDLSGSYFNVGLLVRF